jgi:surface antigen
MSDFAGDPNSFEFGVCTWWGWYMRRDEPQLGTLGMAVNWISAARAKGMSVGYAPVAGATVVFQPGVQGAGGSGHVAHVEQLLGGGWFIISEMNFYWNGGGWGRVDYRYVHAGSGVAFIY